jgi:small subunit ribosomal protein S14
MRGIVSALLLSHWPGERGTIVAKKSIIAREGKRKYAVRVRNRCQMCGRPRGYMRRFGLCRICFRQQALRGHLPGVVKSSW